MCLFITMSLPARCNLSLAQQVFQRHARRFRKLDAPDVQRRLLRPGERYGTITRGSCDCDTVVGCRARALARPGASHERPARFVRRLERHARRSRWAPSRAGREFEKACERTVYEQARETAQQRADAQAWIDLIRDLLDRAGGSGLGLLLHAYEGDIATEPIALLAEERIPVKDLTCARILELRSDVLYRILA